MKSIPFMFKISAMIFVLGFTTCVSRAQGKLPQTDGAFYAISVSNIDEAVNWYSTHLGFKVDLQDGNDQRKGALLSRSGVVLELAEFKGAIALEQVKPGLESHELFGIFKIGFTTSDLDKTFKVLNDAGVEVFFPIVNSSERTRTFGIKDLDGNIIQFFGK